MNGEVKREWFDTDYYAVLGVSEKATQNEITKAYRKLARQYHPDANPDDPVAEEKFKEVSAAYDVIGDESRRSEYDQVRRMGPIGATFGGSGGGFDFDTGIDLGDLLGSMFGGSGGPFGGGQRATRPRRGQDQEARLAISFDEAVQGTLTSISLSDSSGSRTMKVRIPAGVESGQRIRLRGKGGTGDPPGDLYVIVDVGDHPVFDRDGTRLTLELPITIAEAALGADVDVPTYLGERVTVRIPPATQHGRTLRVRGAGAPSDSGPGDLLVTVRVAVPSKLSKAQREALEAFAAASGESPRRHLDQVAN